MTDKNKKGIGYYLLYGVFSLAAMLPFRVLYFISDVLYVLVYKIVGYRKKVVKKNIHNSFPYKNSKELLAIEKEFYRHFCDYFVETIKTLRITDEEIRERMVFENLEIVEQLTRDGNSCLMSLGHCGNWEWVPSII
ncbi:MAG: acetyltransferase, partial [Proteiniphilum sp.]|nr:acetyltransferase [Proteiniphilum sp.]